jgi:predicted AAA+ superfamily ATPase
MIRDIARTKSRSEMIQEILMSILVILISTFLLRLLWNQSLAKHITVFKQIETLGDAFLLSVSLCVLRGC